MFKSPDFSFLNIHCANNTINVQIAHHNNEHLMNVQPDVQSVTQPVVSPVIQLQVQLQIQLQVQLQVQLQIGL